jgi:hypothetical protein
MQKPGGIFIDTACKMAKHAKESILPVIYLFVSTKNKQIVYTAIFCGTN